MTSLFRKEAVDEQRAKLWGEVIIVQPMSYGIIIALLMALFIGAGLFLNYQSYARKETVQGFLTPSGGLTRVYANRGGTLDRLYFNIGDVVLKGQTLADIRIDGRLTSGTQGVQVLRQSLEREFADLNHRLTLASERMASEILGLRSRLAGQEKELVAAKKERQIMADRVALVREKLLATEELADKGFATRRSVEELNEVILQLRQQEVAIARQIINLETAIDQSKGSIDMLPLRIEDEKAGLRQRKEAIERELSERSLAAEYSVSAPIDGIVTNILKSEGDTLQGSTPLVVIKPSETSLQAKLLVPSRSAGLIAVGQTVRIQYDAFPYQRFGVYKGSIVSIAETIVAPNEIQVPITMQEAFYIVDVDLEREQVVVGGQNIPLKSDMVLTADITLEERSLAQWIFDPILSIRAKL